LKVVKRATMTIPSDIAPGLAAYLADQRATPALTEVVHEALAAFLAERGICRVLGAAFT
jgi:hypothetical protein